MTIDADLQAKMLRLMYTIRAFESKARELYRANRMRGKFLGALHSYEGEEAIAVGVCVGLRTDDYVLSTHRGHGHCIAKGADPNVMLAELLGKESGISKGRGGSMHMFDLELGLLGGNGIVGAGIPLALGPAFAAQYRETDQVTVCFFGDGGSCQGTFHESLNLASVWNLPVIYICENNLYAVTTPAQQTISIENVAQRSAGYSCPGVTVDGMDVEAVYEATAQAVQHARSGAGPSLIEAKTCRYQAHCMAIPDRRDAEEMEKGHQRDPMACYEQTLGARGTMSETQQEQMHEDVNRQIEAAAQFVESAALPDPATVAEHLWA